MLSSRDKLTIFENVLARVGMNENTLREYNKAISGLMGFQSQMETMPPPAMPAQPMEQVQPQPSQPAAPPMPAPGNPPMV